MRMHVEKGQNSGMGLGTDDTSMYRCQSSSGDEMVVEEGGGEAVRQGWCTGVCESVALGCIK